jgi:DNA-directed RNA polymerase beta' subunit
MGEKTETENTVLIDVEFKRLVELAEFSNAVELINTKINEYYEHIIRIKSGLDKLLEILPAAIDEADRIDKLQEHVLTLLAKRLEKSK